MLHELRACLCVCMLSPFSCVSFFVTLWTVGSRQAPWSMGFSRQNTLEWVAMPSSRESSWPRYRTCVSVSPALPGRFFTTSAIWEAPESTYGLSVPFHLTGILSSTRKAFICNGNGWSRGFCVQFLVRGVWPASGKHWAFSPALKPFTVEGSWWYYWKERFYLLFCGPSSQRSATRKVCN